MENTPPSLENTPPSLSPRTRNIQAGMCFAMALSIMALGMSTSAQPVTTVQSQVDALGNTVGTTVTTTNATTGTAVVQTPLLNGATVVQAPIAGQAPVVTTGTTVVQTPATPGTTTVQAGSTVTKITTTPGQSILTRDVNGNQVQIDPDNEVYVVYSDGARAHLNDGITKLADGTTITVQDGKRIQ